MNFRNFLLVLFGASGVVIATVTSVAARSDALLAPKTPAYNFPKIHPCKVYKNFLFPILKISTILLALLFCNDEVTTC